VPSRRELEDRRLPVEIQAARVSYRRVYGSRETCLELRPRGVEVGRGRVAWLMRGQRLEDKVRGQRKRTTIPEEATI
jgi:hypothetical protein